MASRPSKPGAPAHHATAPEGNGSGGKLDAVLERVAALRRDVQALRDEVRAMGQRRTVRRERASRDPGDSVPPGVAVQEQAPLSAGERKARRNLERLSRD